MHPPTNCADVIDGLVRLVHGDDDLRTQQLFRQNLQVLVEMAKAEQRAAFQRELACAARYRGSQTLH